MKPAKPIYCQAAMFTCTCCAYATTIYSELEWFSFTSEVNCKTCNGNCMDFIDDSWIFRDDFEEEIYFQMQTAILPDGRLYCEKGTVIGQVHWTALLVHCHTCCMASMVYTKYVVGNNILMFYEECVESNKLTLPQMPYIDERGHHILLGNGLGSEFSAS